MNGINLKLRLKQFIGRRLKQMSAACLFFITAHSVTAQSLDLATALQLTSDKNPELKQFKFKQAALIGTSLTADLKPGFELGTEIENFAGSNPYSGFKDSELTVSLSSIIELGDKRAARLNAVNAQSQLLEAQRQINSLEVMAQLTRTFIAILATQKRSELAAETVKLAAKTHENVNQRAVAGALSDAEVKRAFAALKQAQFNQQSISKKLEMQKLKLSLYWTEKNPKFNFLAGDLYAFGQIKDIEILLNAVDQSTLLKVLATEQLLAESKLRLTQTQSNKDINWSVGVRRIEESNDTALTAGFSMPLFKSKRNQGALIEAQANIDQSITAQQTAQLSLYGQLHEIYSLRALAISEFNTLQDEIIPALSAALDITETAYAEGRYSYLEYKLSREELIEAKHTLINTAENILLYGVEIEQITAEPLYTQNSMYQQKSNQPTLQVKP